MSRKRRPPIYLNDDALKVIFDGLMLLDIEVKKKMARWKNPNDVSGTLAWKNHNVESTMEKVLNEIKQRGIDDEFTK